ncbi:MAG: threonine/serine dehydratase [Candidatus Latescibacteria bacterium]|nr:threonine/serine dehydratase [Candidatus Latescibacterota bacterium]
MITLKEIDLAWQELPPDVVRTPVLRADALSEETSGTVLLKAENLQVTGSYKARASFTILNRLSDDEKRRGAAISSSGNFAAAFAHMGTRLGIPTTVVMMQKTSPYKVERTRRFGAEVVLCENRHESRWETLDRLKAERGITVINTFEEPNVMRGHGTIGLEIMEHVPDVDVVLVPISSGGLIAGVATAVKEIRPSARVIGVQPEGSQAMYRSFRQGQVCGIDEARTICDALIAGRPGVLPFEHVQRYVDDVVLVSDEQVKHAVRTLAGTTKLVVEPSGAVGIAAMQAGLVDVHGQTVVALVSGGNIALAQLAGILGEAEG